MSQQPMSYSQEQIDAVAIAICRADRFEKDPYRLEPGNCPYGDDDRVVVDKVIHGEPHFYIWRMYETHAIAAIEAFISCSEQRK